MTTLRLLPDLEASLRRIPGVRAASVVTGPDARPTEVHVLASPGKPAKQVVRDVQAVALAQHDLEIDHRIVSVVQIAEDGEEDLGTAPGDGGAPAVAESAAARAVLVSITTSRSAGTSTVTVVLSVDDEKHTGTVAGAASAAHRPRLVAEATLAALGDLLGVPALVSSTQIVPVGDHAVALTVLRVDIPRIGEQTTSGSAIVRADAEDAVARSVLAAVNRRLSG